MRDTSVVLGPPGCGKTTTLLGRVDEELARGTPPDRIGYLSFTKRAANEAVVRACAKFDLSKSQLKWFRTIHSLCFSVLGVRPDDVLNGVRLTRDFADYARVKITAKWSDDGTLAGFEPGDRALFLDNLARVNLIPLKRQFDIYGEDPGVSWAELQRVSSCLRAFKDQKGYLDFTDMLEEFVRSDVDLGLEVLFVDEGQDLSRLQWKVIDRLARGARRLVIAGDDDQAIYGWAGADVNGFIEYPGRSEVLGQSWRVPRAVQHQAESLIRQVRNRRPKEWAARDAEGTLSRARDLASLSIEGNDTLILARNNFIIPPIEAELRRRGILYSVGERQSVAASVTAAVRAWEHLRRGERVPIDDARAAYAKMKTRSSVAHGFKTLKDFDDDDQVSMEDLRARGGLLTDGPWFEALDSLPSDEVAYLRRCLQAGEKLGGAPRVRVQTIHTAKGGEADHVVLMLEVAKRTHRASETYPDDELRAWYVGVTRAKNKLTLVESSTNLSCRWM